MKLVDETVAGSNISKSLAMTNMCMSVSNGNEKRGVRGKFENILGNLLWCKRHSLEELRVVFLEYVRMSLHRFMILDEEEHKLHGEESVLICAKIHLSDKIIFFWWGIKNRERTASRELFREESVDQWTRVIDNRMMMVQEELDKLKERDTKMRAPWKKLVHGQRRRL